MAPFSACFCPPRTRRTSPASPAGTATSPRVVPRTLRPWFPSKTPVSPLFSPFCGTITTTVGTPNDAKPGAFTSCVRPRRAPPRARRRLVVLGARVERLGRSCRPRSPARPRAAKKQGAHSPARRRRRHEIRGAGAFYASGAHAAARSAGGCYVRGPCKRTTSYLSPFVPG